MKKLLTAGIGVIACGRIVCHCGSHRLLGGGSTSPKELRVNNGEVPQYYMESSHEAIIAPEEFETVREEMSRRKELGRAYSDKAFHSMRNSKFCKSQCFPFDHRF